MAANSVQLSGFVQLAVQLKSLKNQWPSSCPVDIYFFSRARARACIHSHLSTGQLDNWTDGTP
jgi:hypothetical protein